MNRVFYKFRSHRNGEDLARTLRIISEGQIYATKFRELNDPAEGDFKMADGSAADLETRKVLHTQIRVVSLCRFYSNALLWSYYADSYSGVCLAISFPDDHQPESVIYNALHDSIVPDRYAYGHAEAAKRHARRKLDYWKHELEYRVIKLANSEEDKLFVPCTVHGALFGVNTPKEDRSAIEDAGKSVNPDFFTDEVELSAGFSHPCLGTGLGAHPRARNNPWWLSDGGGPLFRTDTNKCFKCDAPEIGDLKNGYFLEEHLLKEVDAPDYKLKANTILLCPSCHRKAHIDRDFLRHLGGNR
ncbi:hypothetical protein SH580_05420 [Coraliomargarita algicola]|uniref:DUF2971 domain-containing protein n=1 Tax=Coraliomargarita algicola TaxID=3092156 RepID=A0ABZ0RPU6_9BACT|nr:hypothetical protein [Coraliomargarita sp. J2-16]WPJ97146.1 hypothetical protein SH580_05420 [Coraliomargarita sp. J2-16]